MDEKRILLATSDDTEEILALYRTHLYGAADWTQDYPNLDTIEFDLSRNALYVMKNEKNEIIATISIDEDQEVNALPNWNPDLAPGGEVSRLCVRKDMQNQGIARLMMQHVFQIMKEQGIKSIHILVKTGHKVAMASYSKLGFRQVGECHLFEKDFWCLELVL